MASKRVLENRSDFKTSSKKRRVDDNLLSDEETLQRYELVAGMPIMISQSEIRDSESNTNKYLSIAESGVLQASLIHSIKTILHEPIIFKKYYHKIRDSQNINNNISIKIFFLKLSHLKKTFEQPYYYYISYLNYYKEYLKSPNGKHNIKNSPDEVTHQSMNGSMHRLFDTVMKINSCHQFNIRLFILKNDEIEEEYDIELSKEKEILMEEREKTKELKAKTRLERLERQQKVKEEKVLIKLKQQELKEKQQIEKKKNKELKQKQKEEDKLRKEKEKEERKKEKLLKEQQKKEKASKLEEFRKKMTQIDVERHSLKEKERYKREHFAAKYSNRDNKNEEVLSGKALEDKKMIYNLNQMGKKDEHLSKLMKVLASGNGSKDEIAEFKTYMETARNMKAPPNWNGNEKEVAKQKKKVDSEQLKKNKKEDEEKLNEELTKIQDLRKTLQDKKDALQKEKDLYLTEQENIERESINAQRKKDNDNLKEPVVDIIKKPNENQKKVTKEVEMKTEPEKSTSGNISLHNEKMRAEETEQKSETQAYEENLEDKQIKAEGEEEEDINDISQYEASLEKSGKKKKLAYEDQLTNFQNKYTSKCDLVFEFLDNMNQI
ncbi:hypothetical protein QEN19_002160 [Hanseniaspora menglaensis]